MEVTLPPDLTEQVRQEIASGRYRRPDDLIEIAVRHFLDETRRGHERMEAIRRIGDAVDKARLYEKTLVPDQQ